MGRGMSNFIPREVYLNNYKQKRPSLGSFYFIVNLLIFDKMRKYEPRGIQKFS